MNQLDLFGLPVTPEKELKKPAAKDKKEDLMQGKEQKPMKEHVLEEINKEALSAIEKAVFNNFRQDNLPENTRVAPAPVERNGDIIFEDNNITVKIKAKPVSKKQAGEANDAYVEGSLDRNGKPQPRRSIVTRQPKSEYSIALNEKLSQVKNNIKEGLLKDAAEKKKQKKEGQPQQKRGRKTFKEIDIEADLINVPEDEVLFKKQYYPISEVAGWFNVNTSLLRFWENEFDILKPRKNRKGDRHFRPEDVKNLQLIHLLLRQKKFSIEGAREYIKTNKGKVDVQMQLTQTLQKFRGFLLELKANL
ncbi:MAG: MerR family transcriptional regulator [Chitinophagaceae bacterium]|nr:MerR family transcriptional regulator [Chitinophagaceae bacterium]